jgi:hypothetical protein
MKMTRKPIYLFLVFGTASSFTLSPARFFQTLQLHHLKIASPPCHQLRVGPGLDQASVIKHADEIRLLNRAQPMCHGDSGAMPRGGVQCFLHNLFRLGIEGGRGLVQEQDRRVA